MWTIEQITAANAVANPSDTVPSALRKVKKQEGKKKTKKK